MKKYVVIGAYASFMSGVLMLTREQYKAREHALEPLGEDLYSVIQQTGFKRDEIVGFDGEVNKALLQDITPMPEAPKDGKSEPVTINPLEPHDLFPSEVLDEDLQSPVGIQTFGEFLTKSIEEIREALPGLPDDNLLTMLAVEVEGKKRKGVIKAIEAEIEKRVEPDADNATGDNAE